MVQISAVEHCGVAHRRNAASNIRLTIRGVTLEQGQETLDHSTIEMTKRYAHFLGPLRRDAAELFDACMSGGSWRDGSPPRAHRRGIQLPERG